MNDYRHNLICLVQKTPLLWDPKNKDYKNKDQRKQVWERIDQKLKPPRDDTNAMASTLNSPLAKQKNRQCGWLRKQGGMVRSWHRRWFVLNGDFLFYFTKEVDVKPLGTIYLPGNRIIEHSFRPDEPEKFLFEILPGRGQDRMTPNHESYLICADSDEERQKWIKNIRRVMFQDVGGAIFGQIIGETMKYEKKKNPDRKVPYIIEECVEFLTIHGLEIEGVFRLPGRTSLIRDLKEAFDCGERLKLNAEDHDVHSVASLLKLYLRELPESIIPNRFYQQFMNVADRYQNKEDFDYKKELCSKLSLLPEDNYHTLDYLCSFIHKVGQNEKVNKMSETNLATVFGPNIIRHFDEANTPEFFMATANLTHHLAYLLIHFHGEVFTLEFNDNHVAIHVGDLLGIDSEDSGSMQSPLAPSSDILSAVTTRTGFVFDHVKQLSEKSTSSSTGTKTSKSVVQETKSLDISTEPKLRSRKDVKSLTLPARPIPPKRKTKQKKKLDVNSSVSGGGDRSSLTDSSSADCTPTTPDRWFDPPESPSPSVTAQNRSHVIYSDDLESDVVISNNNNDSQVYSPTEALQQQNEVLREALSRTKSKYESQQKSLMADRDNMKKHYDTYITSLEEMHSTQLQELKDKLESTGVDNRTNTSTAIPQSENADYSSKLQPSVPEMLLNVAALKDELSRNKFKYDTQVNSLKEQLTNMKQRYDAHIKGLEQKHEMREKDLRKQLEAEKASRKEAVAKIVLLQAQLHRYQMTYGELAESTEH